MESRRPTVVRVERPPDKCELCGRSIDSYSRVRAAVCDSTYLDPHNRALDGCRITYACSREHATALAERGRRLWVDEELWTAKLNRVRAQVGDHETTLEGMASRAGLTERQLRRAIDWGTRVGTVPLPRRPGRSGAV